MREAIHKLRDLCQSSVTKPRGDPRWLSNLESTHYLHHIRTVLQGVARVVGLVGKEGVSVLLHCSDGWDRTPQMSSLSMLLLDPYYRTLEGFAVLIEKEWCSFGHKFASRLGHAREKYPDTQLSPIFLQYLDCVWQCTQQYPHAFEFNEALLIELADAMYSCQYGTFLFNCEKERVDAGVLTKTQSFWSHVLSHRVRYTSRGWHPDRDPQDGVLMPSYSAQDVTLWSGYFMRWDSNGSLLSDSAGVQGKSAANGVERELAIELDKVLIERGELEAELKKAKIEITSLKLEITELKERAVQADTLRSEVDSLRQEITMMKAGDPLGAVE